MSGLKSLRTAVRVRPGIALVLLTVVVSGVSNFVNFTAVQGTNVDAWIAVRNTAVAGMLVPAAMVLGLRTRIRLHRSEWLRLAAIGLIGGAVPFLLYFHGFQLASRAGGAASASLGYRSLFLGATALGVIFLRERVPKRFALAAGLLLAGNVLLLTLTGPLWTDGTAYVLLATSMWACEYAMSKRVLRALPSGTVALGRMGFGAVFLLAYLGLTGQAGAVARFAPADWMSLFLSALLLFAFVTTWYAGLNTVDLATATSMLVLAFPITWALGLVAGRGFGVSSAAGAVAILLGIGVLLGTASLRGVGRTLTQAARSSKHRVV